MRRRNLLKLLTVTTVALLYTGAAPAHGGVDFLKPRVAEERLASVKLLKNPVSTDGRSIAAGKEIYYGKGLCVSCHGESGKGDGPGGASFDPGPRDFTNASWQSVRTDGEIFTAITEGTQYGMIAFGDNLTEKEKWEVINYLRTFGAGGVAKNTRSENSVK